MDQGLKRCFKSSANCQFLNRGTFNEIFLIELRNGKKYIARRPFDRLTEVVFYNAIAVLNYLSSILPFPVPKVFAADYHSRPQYMIQTFFHGTCLGDAIYHFNFAQRCSLAAKIAECMVAMFSTRFDFCGNLIGHGDRIGVPAMEKNYYHFSYRDPYAKKPHDLNTFIESRLTALYHSSNGDSKWFFFQKIFASLELPSCTSYNCLAHPDFFARNILVDTIGSFFLNFWKKSLF